MNVADKYKFDFVVTEKIYNGFIAIFGDNNPLHTDQDYAVEKNFKGKVMHGNILNGFVSYFIGMCLPKQNVIIQSQEIKYHKPVYLEDILSFEAEIVDFRESVKQYEIKFSFRKGSDILVAKGVVKIGVI